MLPRPALLAFPSNETPLALPRNEITPVNADLEQPSPVCPDTTVRTMPVADALGLHHATANVTHTHIR